MLETLFASLNEGKNCKVFLGVAMLPPPPNHPVLFYNKPQLFVNNLLCSDSSQDAIMVSQSLIRFYLLQGYALIKSLHLELKYKDFLMIGLDLSGCAHKKRVKCENYILLLLYSYILFFVILWFFLTFNS